MFQGQSGLSFWANNCPTTVAQATALTIERISRLGTTTAYRLLRWCALTL